jgi:hypothetical protein
MILILNINYTPSPPIRQPREKLLSSSDSLAVEKNFPRPLVTALARNVTALAGNAKRDCC